jgi:hypothetical protein
MVAEGNDENKKMEQGGKNLVLLGVFATLIAVITTGVSLMLYHNSGDIYLDRSRPGFLPDEEEAEEEKVEEEYTFSRSGKITGDVLDELLKNLDLEVQSIDTYGDQFGEGALSDERLGIPLESNDETN